MTKRQEIVQELNEISKRWYEAYENENIELFEKLEPKVMQLRKWLYNDKINLKNG